ncbi:MAG: hypothetical protein ACXVGN_00035 [Mycobacteriaceae bacterium]
MRISKRERDAELARSFIDAAGVILLLTTSDPISDRFWSKFELRDGHWLWTRAKDSRGAGQFGIAPSVTVKANRFAWEQTVGRIPDGMVLTRLSSCPYVECANPECHGLATKAEAAGAAGRRGGRGKLAPRPRAVPVACSQQAVDVLYAMQQRGIPKLQILRFGRRLGLGPTTVQHIIKGNARGVR